MVAVIPGHRHVRLQDLVSVKLIFNFPARGRFSYFIFCVIGRRETKGFYSRFSSVQGLSGIERYIFAISTRIGNTIPAYFYFVPLSTESKHFSYEKKKLKITKAQQKDHFRFCS
ncbi:hypothetical protein ED312_22200 [Sinomicrobium pectinilyticum]|uniref:Uncharacterized protein n=1 Tax=Sinomicrobium pectinilyticum TaxID=1084421 RepID=A0A3N0D358_SINP1|nr:hypothetical protein ED312_22200 [Sinomicrobium pectinilyticum]